ncbi:MAG: hypothetical protein GKR89_15270 [Candidatus Latescibacteria bacterium]|nr:hypothetical protein [Candidatus Latescibacterota bacterium]
MQLDFIIKLNRTDHTVCCPLCHQTTAIGLGPALALETPTGNTYVCDVCGQEQAPALATLVEMARLSLVFSTEHFTEIEEQAPLPPNPNWPGKIHNN